MPPPVIGAVVSAANYQAGPIAPGEIITIGGSGLGPAAGATLALDQSGNVATSLGGVQVSIGGRLAPLTYVSATQINCVVPYEWYNSTVPYVQVAYQGQVSALFPVTGTSAVPALFTADGSGSGVPAAFNQDGSYLNSAHPAPKGSVVTLFLTGEGMTGSPVTGVVTAVADAPPLTPSPDAPNLGDDRRLARGDLVRRGSSWNRGGGDAVERPDSGQRGIGKSARVDFGGRVQQPRRCVHSRAVKPAPFRLR